MHSDLSSEPQPSRLALQSELRAVVAAHAQGAELPLGCVCIPIYQGRNTLYAVRLSLGEKSYVVKLFARLPLWRCLYYSYLGQSKAARSYANACKLLSLGFGTPPPVGYDEERNGWGLIGRSSFSCELLEGVERGIYPHIYGWTAPEGFLEALAIFAARLHESGVEHQDLSPGNILYRYSKQEGYHFYLVDLNRMRFRGEALGLRDAAHNLSRLFVARSVSSQFGRHYARARGWEAREVMEAIDRAADSFWLRRLGKLSRRWCAKHLHLSVAAYYGVVLRYRALRLLRRLLPQSWGLYRKVWLREEALYGRYFSAEDIRHTLRHREGYGYTIHHRH